MKRKKKNNLCIRIYEGFSKIFGNFVTIMHKDLITLKKITAPILDDIKIFQQEFENALKSEVRLINSISK